MRLHNIDLKKLRAFQLAARHQSVRRAAQELSVTVSAVSMQLAALERELGAKLLQRVGNRMLTTATGALLVPEVEKIFSAVEGAIEAVLPKAQTRGRVAVSINTNVTHHFSGIVARYIHENPDIEVSLQVRRSLDTLSMVMNGEVDLGVGYFERVPTTLKKRKIWKSGYALLIPSDYPIGLKQSRDLQALAKQRFIILRNGSEMWKRMEKCFGAAGVEATKTVETGNCLTSRELAEKGIGIAIVHTACLDDRQPNTLRKVDISDLLGTDDVAVVYRNSPMLLPHQLNLLNLLAGVTR